MTTALLLVGHAAGVPSWQALLLRWRQFLAEEGGHDARVKKTVLEDFSHYRRRRACCSIVSGLVGSMMRLSSP